MNNNWQEVYVINAIYLILWRYFWILWDITQYYIPLCIIYRPPQRELLHYHCHHVYYKNLIKTSVNEKFWTLWHIILFLHDVLYFFYWFVLLLGKTSPCIKLASFSMVTNHQTVRSITQYVTSESNNSIYFFAFER